MGLKDILLKIKQLAVENGTSPPFIVGGLPRDKILNRISKVADIDITCGDDSIVKLAEVTATHFHVYPVRFPDKHIQLYIDGIHFDFSSNYLSPDVERFLHKAGIKKPSPLQKELFSRDFTCNALVIPFNLRKIQDYTGLALTDIEKKTIRTLLPPRITLRDNPKRVIRAIYLAAKLGFKVELDIIRWVRRNNDVVIKNIAPGFTRQKLAYAARCDLQKTIDLMTQMDLWNIPGIPNGLLEAAGSKGLL